jgi:hypothetical protein
MLPDKRIKEGAKVIYKTGAVWSTTPGVVVSVNHERQKVQLRSQGGALITRTFDHVRMWDGGRPETAA